jgi:hypothetical protein
MAEEQNTEETDENDSQNIGDADPGQRNCTVCGMTISEDSSHEHERKTGIE